MHSLAIATNLAMAVALTDRRVLVVDADYQANSTAGLDITPDPSHMLSAWLPQYASQPTIHVHAHQSNLGVLPAFITMADDEWEIDERRCPIAPLSPATDRGATRHHVRRGL